MEFFNLEHAQIGTSKKVGMGEGARETKEQGKIEGINEFFVF